jgi:hypothetical protein
VLYIIQHKFDVFFCFKKFQFFSFHEIGNQILKIHFDCGGEFMNIAFQKHLVQHGFHHDLTTPYTPEQNSVVEDDNHTILEMVCSMLHALKIYLSFWAAVVQIAVYNIAGCTLPDFTPLEVWCGKKPNLSHMRVFWSTTYMHVHKENNHKLELKSLVYMFFRYCVESKTYQLWGLISWKKSTLVMLFFKMRNL